MQLTMLFVCFFVFLQTTKSQKYSTFCFCVCLLFVVCVCVCVCVPQKKKKKTQFFVSGASSLFKLARDDMFFFVFFVEYLFCV